MLIIPINEQKICTNRYETPTSYYVADNTVYVAVNIFKSTHTISHESEALLNRFLFGDLKKKGQKIVLICDYPTLVQRNYPLYNFEGHWTGKTKIVYSTGILQVGEQSA